MSFAQLKDSIPDFGRDIRLNLEAVLSPENNTALSAQQIWAVALASAYSLDSKPLVQAILHDGASALDDAMIHAAKAAATIMAMNNVYYRSMHLMEDAELKKLPARLRMNVIGKPGIEKREFEMMSFAVSAINGCGQCLTAHLNELRKAGLSDEGVQATLRIASTLNAADRALKIAAL